ncbi:50S ribosomal protein L3 [Candidatus Wolfebacteria bacterium]|nr:MAG: 50S ribosomal protein L3 [Candidatus Wolfebacteria bacterium]
MKFILGTKQYMTEIFDEEGLAIPATVISAGPVVVTQIKTVATDGYSSVQVGFGTQSDKHINKAEKGHMKGGSFRYLKEFTLSPKEVLDYKIGDTIDLSIFEVGDKVVVRGTSKGKGFQGGVKRHGFAGGRRSHGNKHAERQPGSIGATGPQRVFKGKKMAGRMGTDKVSQKNLKVAHIDLAENLIAIKGAVPGIPGALIEITS